ncbi:hypothetical protein E2C01_016788 [Portunus trituberculatus]|uniref:Uncharacterized protein n=1 Tax=Portunus trituberculatus TaxID=210409 RepID=A0A5B7DQQ7_PORTR|nr:hypothetical protein [Portunus trituberculatus]
MPPKVRERRPVFASGDVYSLAFLLQELTDSCIQPWLAVPLNRNDTRCKDYNDVIALTSAMRERRDDGSLFLHESRGATVGAWQWMQKQTLKPDMIAFLEHATGSGWQRVEES